MQLKLPTMILDLMENAMHEENLGSNPNFVNLRKLNTL